MESDFFVNQYIKDKDCDFLFASPYRLWERGCNKNLNGFIR
jgi:IS30 family transposase